MSREEWFHFLNLHYPYSCVLYLVSTFKILHCCHGQVSILEIGLETRHCILYQNFMSTELGNNRRLMILCKFLGRIWRELLRLILSISSIKRRRVGHETTATSTCTYFPNKSYSFISNINLIYRASQGPVSSIIWKCVSLFNSLNNWCSNSIRIIDERQNIWYLVRIRRELGWYNYYHIRDRGRAKEYTSNNWCNMYRTIRLTFAGIRCNIY